MSVAGDLSPELTCSCGARFRAPTQAVQECRDSDGVHFMTLGFASHNDGTCTAAGATGTKSWIIWELEEG